MKSQEELKTLYELQQAQRKSQPGMGLVRNKVPNKMGPKQIAEMKAFEQSWKFQS